MLIIEDSDGDTDLLLRELARGGYAPAHRQVETIAAIEEALGEQAWQLVLSDYSLPGFEAPVALDIVRTMAPYTPAIVVSGVVGEEAAVECMRAGARDFLTKANLDRLNAAVARELADARDRRDRETELSRLVAELRRSNEDLEQFASVASHDLQEPLRMVTSYMELLSRRHSDQLDDRAKKYVAYAADGARRMKLLIDDVLAYSRIRTSGLRPRRCDIEAIVSAAISDLSVAVQESKAEVTHGALPTVQADASQLEQLFRNLIGNAIKFRSEEAPRIRVEAQRLESGWQFCVADNGIGFDLEHADRIFDMFQRLNERGQYGGSGIGLAISRRIVERHGGRMWAESTPGVGSRFLFELPDAMGREDVDEHAPQA